MVCPMRIIVIAVSAIVAAALALIALLSDEKETPPTEKQNEEEPRSLAWQTIDFLNGKFLYRQYIRCRGTSKKDN
jgi:hypothetical protein